MRSGNEKRASATHTQTKRQKATTVQAREGGGGRRVTLADLLDNQGGDGPGSGDTQGGPGGGRGNRGGNSGVRLD